ncbi:MAG: hypothetical protein B7Z72_05310 [Gemmatimonadetes bacterium 21-71-4]|nr:MAG: hypothetical protein B7Z72_05310 [Gemmatimonadetes bacterium 21-71-4]
MNAARNLSSLIARISVAATWCMRTWTRRSRCIRSCARSNSKPSESWIAGFGTYEALRDHVHGFQEVAAYWADAVAAYQAMLARVRNGSQ